MQRRKRSFDDLPSPNQSHKGPLVVQHDVNDSTDVLKYTTDYALLGDGDPADVCVTAAEGSDSPGDTQEVIAGEADLLTIADSELFCPIDPNDIANRWITSFISGPEQTVKEYPDNVAKFMSRMLKSYSAVAVSGRGLPPFVHSAQVTSGRPSSHLSTCLNLVRLFAPTYLGSRDPVPEIVQKQMNTIHDLKTSSDNMILLEAFQSYLIYIMVLYFWCDAIPHSSLRQAMIHLQELACASARGGLVCEADRHSMRPRWGTWICVEAKRRTLYTMYMLDSVLLTRDGLPNYLGIELKGLPSPAEKTLWGASEADEWRRLFNEHLAAWPDGYLCIDELWPINMDLNETDIRMLHRRVDHWLEGVDEFGTMLFAVTSCTHGC